MNDSQMITIAGQIGSGKTEVSRVLAQKTGREMISTGVILRKMAAEYGVSVLELNDRAARNPEIDKEIDAHLKALYERPRPAIVDSRLGWHFIPSSFKAYLVVDPIIGAERVYSAIRPDEQYTSIAAAAGNNLKRQKYENERFWKLYSIKCEDWRNYDLVIDTSQTPPERIADLILEEQKAPQNTAFERRPHCWLSPKRLIPTQNIRELAEPRAMEVYQSVHQAGFDKQKPIDIALFEGHFLIIDGHLRASAALRTEMPLIPCNLRASEDEFVAGDMDVAKFALTSTFLSWIHAWEEAHQFRFKSYPGWLMVHQA